MSGIVAGIIFFLLTFITGGLGSATEPAFVSGGWPQFLAQWFTNYAPLGEMVGLGMVGLAAIMIYLTLFRTLKVTSPNYALICLGFGVIASAILVSFLVLRYYALFSAAIVYNSAAGSEKPTVINMARVLVYSTYGLFFTQGVLWIFAFLGTGVAIRSSRTFGRGYSWMNVAFGLLFILLVAIAAEGFATPDAPNTAFLFIGLTYVVWTIVLGQKLYRLSRPWS
ncbi:MAG: hypothetical protein E6K96_00865 [Thaumarchaeota archaeon]|nr:MAG: hypothetical protein E6K96_00865 [Nitrososphaerota archaeon]